MNINKIQQEYTTACATPSDINEHLPTLYKYARECKHITEMGVRGVVSTWAFLMANPEKYVGYDISEHPNMAKVLDSFDNAEMFIADVLNVDIEETDFLFIDTYHTATQLEKELARHASKAKKYIGFHDTTTFWNTGEQPYNHNMGHVACGRGLRFALEPFLKNNPEWKIAHKLENNNGLTIIERK